jgi:hypothetical protein
MIYVKLPGIKPFQFGRHRTASSPATVFHKYLYTVRITRGNITLLVEEISISKFEQRTEDGCPKLITNFS